MWLSRGTHHLGRVPAAAARLAPAPRHQLTSCTGSLLCSQPLPWCGGVGGGGAGQGWRSSNSAASPGPPPPALFISPAEYLWLCPTLNLTFQPYRRPTVPCTHVISVLLRGLSFPLGAHVPPSPSCRRPPRLLRSNQSIVATCRRLPGPDPHPSAHFHRPARSHLGRGSSEHTGFAPREGCHTVRAAPSSQLRPQSPAGRPAHRRPR